MPTAISRHSLSSLPAWARAELALPRAIDPFLSDVWFEILLESCSEPDWRPDFLALDGGASGRGVAALRERRHLGRHVTGFTNFYTCRFAPVLGAAGGSLAAPLAEWLAADRPRIDTVQFDTMRPGGNDLTTLIEALRGSGFAVQRYEQFGNWFEPVAGVGYDAYLAARDGQLRSTIERKGRRFLKQAGARIDILSNPAELERGLAAYLDVHARSWKEPEPFPAFIPSFVRRFGAIGALEIGVAWLHNRPLAAQIWLRWGRRATIAKLAYDDDAKALSPGTVLTAHMIRHALEARTFDEIDLGRGDDPYKRHWLRERRPVFGLVAANLRSVPGLWAAARHFAPPAMRRLTARLRTMRSGA